MAHTPAAPAPKGAPLDAHEGSELVGKGRPTPTRAEREAANKRPLVADTKEAKTRARAELNEKRDKARIGLANGEEKYLPLRDRGPQRKFIRDYVDAGWHLGEAVMPAMILTMFIPSVDVQYWAFIALWIFILFVIGDMVLTSIRSKQAAKQKFGVGKVEKGLGWYAAMRTIQMRFMRLPKPQVKRGGKIV